ncbi:MAG: bifunctional 5,10-methylenetetrahydrofolate dehydrogenase/5,10-methenyltetrahydrofolate cyclohydrolase [Clostridiales bacterium]|nr:bifunctional 5,10-methylenetetrahydrofolate dehydrogenase/5,10-methenyltetrahydrofolate cyclohydrolase [Clostridiales bacterium]
MAKLLLGKEVTQSIDGDVAARAQRLSARGVQPTLAIVRVGEDPSDLSYERGAMRRAEGVGIAVRRHMLPADADRDQLLDVIDALNEDDSVHGVLLFRPLPGPLRAYQTEIMNRLRPEKDVDCMTDLSNAGVFEGRADLGFPPCTPEACMAMLSHYGVDLTGKRAVVIGRSMVVGRPLSMMLMAANATVTTCHTRTVDVPGITRTADVLVTSAGKLGSLTREFVREGQIVIDVSINWDEDKPNAKGGRGAIAGDCVFDEVEPVVQAITPVPGGVGAVTTSILLRHVIEAAERSAETCC